MNKESVNILSYEVREAMKKEEFESLKKSLKCCPFCGQPVRMKNIFYGSGNYGSGSKLVIVCDTCKLQMSGVDTSWSYEYDHIPETKELVEKWNTRVS